jgi:pyruvate, water dikinase
LLPSSSRQSNDAAPARSPLAAPAFASRILVGALLALANCGTPAEDRLQVRIATRDGAPISSFLATVAWADGRVESLSCPPEATPAPQGLRCEPGGFDSASSAALSEVTLRSRGSAFVSTPLGQTKGSVKITVSPLAEPDNTPDYATRLDGPDCLVALEELSLPFRSDAGDSYSVKFYIRDLATEPRVYFQNTRKYPLHYEFARNVLGVAGTADQFAADTYAGLERPAMAGTLIFYPSVRGKAHGATPEIEAPWSLNFFPSDTLTTDQVRRAHRLLEERVTCFDWTGPARRLLYVPASSERESEAAQDQSGFDRAGIGWMSHAALVGGLRLQALNEGVAFGSLLRVTPEQLTTKVLSFRDILLLTRLPNELPLVGGTITEEFQTPLAHVNVAARSRGTPNLAYPEAFQDQVISSRIGELVRFEVTPGAFTLQNATVEQAEAFWNERQRERYVPRFDSSTAGIPEFADFGFADSVRVGAKAANLAELSHILGDNAPKKGLAIPFHYYEAFMSASKTSNELCDGAESSCLEAGRDPATCQAARALCMPEDTPETFSSFVGRVVHDADFNRDTALRDAVLANLRYGIETTPVDDEFGDLLDGRVAEVFGDAKVKIRSSTNAEDLPDFSGAGLYDSYAAHADGADAASQVVRKVFASVWNFRAFEERSFWNIDHEAVRMGCAINQAFSHELANGVLITQNIADPTVYGMYVNVQLGEASVTNPKGGEQPEIFSILADTGYQLVRQRFSSLAPDRPILSDDEIASLYEAGARASAHFSKLYGRDVVLDIEFKLTPEHQIVFKQARPYTP